MKSLFKVWKPRRLVAGFVVWFFLFEAVSALSFEISGNYKNLLSASKTQLKEDYNLDLNRLRLQIKSQLSENLSADLQYDIEAYLGSLLKTSTFTAFKNYRPPTKFDLISTLLDSENLYVRQKLYRFYFTCALPLGDLKIGRQKIPWGVGRVWNATDPFNPVDFVNLEREERVGVDGISLDIPLSALAGLNLVYVEGKSNRSMGGRLRTNIEGTDYSVLGAKLGSDYLLGFDFAGQIRGAGVRGEFAYTKAQAEADYLRLVLSCDYTFPSSLYFLTEFYYNGQHYGFLGLTYDIFSLLKGGIYFMYNMDDGSNFVNPFLDYSLSENSSWVIGSHILSGKTGSEFGAFSNVYYAQIKWFF